MRLRSLLTWFAPNPKSRHCAPARQFRPLGHFDPVIPAQVRGGFPVDDFLAGRDVLFILLGMVKFCQYPLPLFIHDPVDFILTR